MQQVVADKYDSSKTCLSTKWKSSRRVSQKEDFLDRALKESNDFKSGISW
jgi:hypothetical protein